MGYSFPYKKLPKIKINSNHLSHQTYQRFPHCANYFFEANEPPKAKNIMMDLSKLNIDILNGSNWGTWSAQVQSAARILNCWDVIKGEVVVPVTTPPMYQLLTLLRLIRRSNVEPKCGKNTFLCLHNPA